MLREPIRRERGRSVDPTRRHQMRKFVLPLLALAALALAAPALAKEPKSATACGADGCATTNDREGLLNLMNGNGSAPPPAAGDYYKVTMTIDVPPDAGVGPKVE